MKMLKKVNAIIFSLAVLLAVACGKDDDNKPVPDPGPASADPNIPVSKKCFVTRYAYAKADGSYSTANLYTYDTLGRVTQKTAETNGNLSAFYSIVEYNNVGKISRILNYDNTRLLSYEAFFYNADGLLVNYENYNRTSGSLAIFRSYDYEYNAAKKLIKLNRFDEFKNLYSYTIYTYPTGNTAVAEEFYIQGGNTVKGKTFEYTFDDKKSPAVLLGVLYSNELLFSNNIVIRKMTMNNSKILTDTSTYEYNAEGYPTKITISDNGTPGGVINYTYNCQ